MGEERVEEAAPVLTSLVEALRVVVKHTDSGWQLVSASGLDDGAPIVDVDGTVLQVLADHDAANADPAAKQVVAALVAAYDYVLQVQGTAHRALARAEQAEADARTDPLTGLGNRRAWEHVLAREQSRCDRSNSVVAIAVVDLDDLKEINDGRGHLAGDLLLRQTADRLQGAVRGSDVVARTGGDEFAVLAVDFPAADPDAFVKRLRAVLDDAGIHASTGVAVHRPGQPLAASWAAADRAMYQHKRNRKMR